MLTAAGQETGDTDLFLMVPEIVGPAQQPSKHSTGSRMIPNKIFALVELNLSPRVKEMPVRRQSDASGQPFSAILATRFRTVACGDAREEVSFDCELS
jgi:hypothetical protein